MTATLVLSNHVTLPDIGGVHQALAKAFAGSGPITIDASQFCEGDFALAQLLAAARAEADRLGRALSWHGAGQPALQRLLERAGFAPSCAEPSEGATQ